MNSSETSLGLIISVCAFNRFVLHISLLLFSTSRLLSKPQTGNQTNTWGCMMAASRVLHVFGALVVLRSECYTYTRCSTHMKSGGSVGTVEGDGWTERLTVCAVWWTLKTLTVFLIISFSHWQNDRITLAMLMTCLHTSDDGAPVVFWQEEFTMFTVHITRFDRSKFCCVPLVVSSSNTRNTEPGIELHSRRSRLSTCGQKANISPPLVCRSILKIRW